MSSKAFTKIALDIIMTVLFVILIFAYDTGLAFHDIPHYSELGLGKRRY
jgi:hypothetical protein